MIIKALGVVVAAGMMRLLWPIHHMPREEAPDALIQEVLSHAIVHDERCSLLGSGDTEVECIATRSSDGRLWFILFDDDLKMTKVVLFDGKTNVLWCRKDICA